MKFHFKIQQYQTEAVEAVVRIFQGQPKGKNDRYRRDLGTILDNIHQQQFELPTNTLEDDVNRIDFRELVSENGYKNTAVRLTNEQLLHNIQVLQAENNLAISDNLVTAPGLGRCSLDIEMETGTGKTYVYIKTMFELNKRYGWSKFIVVVPSIAIREGVKKSFEITADHFHEYYGQKARFFVYDSDNLTALDSFSSSSAINVMIINTQAFNTSMNEEKGLAERGGNSIARIIYSKRDSFGSRRPIDVIAANRPILILDEPQKMGKKDSKTQKALRNFNPLFIINYSATHAERHNLIYVLDALDAYNKKLVKKIEVKGFEVKNLRGTDKYLYLQSIVLSANHAPRVKLELEVAHKSGIKREIHTLEVGDNLYYESNNMEQYKGLAIIDIDPYIGTVTFTNGEKLRKGEVVGDASEKTLRRVQIRETILSHIEKEKKLFAKGIKTLSLFFIDEVAKYRQYDENGQELLGEYGQIFEEEYTKIIDELRNTLGKKYEKYLQYLRQSEVHKVHRGYFSIDKKGRSINSSVKRGTDISDDISAYDLILKNKERLLSFDEPTRFIFSHSALREGWDNPNIFQICTLKRSDSTVQKRQEVGRGLRLCVNKQGTRMDADVLKDNVHNVNVLTVIASESYAEFVGELQKQIREVLYNRPTKASIGYFEGKIITNERGQKVKLDEKQAKKIYKYLLKNDYIDDEDNITEKYREEAAAECLASWPEELQPMQEGVQQLIQAIFDESKLQEMTEDGNKPKLQENDLNERFYKREFQTLWKAINHQYIYTVNFDSQELIDKAVKALDAELYVSKLLYTVTYASQKSSLSADMLQEGSSFNAAKNHTSTVDTVQSGQAKYDLIGKIVENTTLTRRTVGKILQLIKPETFAKYAANPEEFIAKAIKIIKEQKASVIVDHITYNTTDRTFSSDIFTQEKIRTMDKAYKAAKAIQDYIFTDGMVSYVAEDGTEKKSVERKFAEDLDKADEVYIYAKLPRGFYIPTPVGDYSPDWAIVFQEGATKHIYFIAETKGSLESLQLRPIEKAKLNCAEQLFSKLSNGLVIYKQVSNYQDLLDKVMQ